MTEEMTFEKLLSDLDTSAARYLAAYRDPTSTAAPSAGGLSEFTLAAADWHRLVLGEGGPLAIRKLIAALRDAKRGDPRPAQIDLEDFLGEGR